MKKKRVRLKRSVVAAFKLIVAILLLVISIYFLVMGSNHDWQQPEQIATLTETNYLDYQVYLKDNPYFTVPYLSKGEHYIASLIDSVQVTYTHKAVASKQLDYNYRYRVVGTLSASEQKDGKAAHKIWNKQYVLTPTKEITKTAKDTYEINDRFNIDYQYYKALANEFKRSYPVATNVMLDIKVYIDMDGVVSGTSHNASATSLLEMHIPLEGDTIQIPTIYEKKKTQAIMAESQKTLLKDKGLFIFGCFTFATSVVVVVSYLLELIHHSKNQFSYAKEKKKILNKYDNIIVNASKIPDLSNMNIIEVTTFHELLDAKEGLKVPIIFIEVIPGMSGWFLMMYQDQIWRYRLEKK